VGEGRRLSALRAGRRFWRRGCRPFFSPTWGTSFHNSHLPLWKWFLVIELFLSTDGGIPANELTKILGGSYKTAWFVEHRIRAAFCTTRPGRRPLRPGPDFVDRTYAADEVGRYHQPGLKYLNAYKADAH